MLINNENFQSILENINELLRLGVKNRNHSFHTPVFSTYNKNNHINSRIVVLRKYDNKSLTLCFNTDIRSPKISEIKIAIDLLNPIANETSENASIIVFSLYDPENLIVLNDIRLRFFACSYWS